MQLIRRNLWDCDGALCITTNGFVKTNGAAVMGRGVAKEATLRIPGIEHALGTRLQLHPNRVQRIAGPDCYVEFDRNVISFPVKHNWWEPADLDLIAQSALELSMILEFYIKGDCFLVKPGCGNGQLDWSDVEPVLDNRLGAYDNLYIVDRP